MTKRANKLYGTDETDEKKAWMEAEFLKRKEKREAKERSRLPQQRHSQSGGAPMPCPVELQPVSEDMNNATDEYMVETNNGGDRDRASSVADSNASSVSDQMDPLSSLRLDPDTAQKLLDNAEAMQLLSDKPDVLAFLRSVVSKNTMHSQHDILGVSGLDASQAPQAPIGPCLRGRSQSPQRYHLGTDAPMNGVATPTVGVEDLLKLSEDEVTLTLSELDPDTAAILMADMQDMLSQQEQERNTVNSNTVSQVASTILQESRPDQALRQILDAPEYNTGMSVDLGLVNDKLLSFSENDPLPCLDESNIFGTAEMESSMGMGVNDTIDGRLFNALKGVLGDSLLETTSQDKPKAPPSTPDSSRKRSAPATEEPTTGRKRRVSIAGQSLPAAPDPSSIADLLRFSGFKFNDFGNLSNGQQAVFAIPPPIMYAQAQAIGCPGGHPQAYVYPGYGTAYPPAYPNACGYPVYAPANAGPGYSNQSRSSIPSRPPYVTSTSTLANIKNSSTNAAHAASFGNSALMNQRLMPPPPYRPPGLGVGYGGITPNPPPRKKMDPKLVRSMGFPPRLTGMGMASKPGSAPKPDPAPASPK